MQYDFGNIREGLSADVIVVGGGPAGMCAAIAAAREGVSVLLVEQSGSCGGMATKGMVGPFMTCYDSKGENMIIRGLFEEIVNRMVAKGFAIHPAEVRQGTGFTSWIKVGHDHVTPFEPEGLKLIIDEMLTEAGVKIMYHTNFLRCVMENNTITGILVSSKRGLERIDGKVIIDCTGDGDVAHLAGAPMMEKKEELQPMSMCFLLDGVDLTTDLMKDCIHHNGLGGKPSENKVIREYLLTRTDKLGQFGGPWFNTLLRGNSVAVNMTRAAGDSTDRESQTQAELKMREDMFTAVDLLKEHFPEFKDAHIVSTPIMVGVRESRHILGVQTALAEEMLAGKRYPCEVAHCAHPMDIHSAKSSAQKLIRFESAAFVPHGALVPQGSKNLVVAGRCLCADQGAYASIRVQATLMSIGEAAGLMAALHCKTGADMAALPEKELAEQFAQRNFVL